MKFFYKALRYIFFMDEILFEFVLYDIYYIIPGSFLTIF